MSVEFLEHIFAKRSSCRDWMIGKLSSSFCRCKKWQSIPLEDCLKVHRSAYASTKAVGGVPMQVHAEKSNPYVFVSHVLSESQATRWGNRVGTLHHFIKSFDIHLVSSNRLLDSQVPSEFDCSIGQMKGPLPSVSTVIFWAFWRGF